MSDYRRIASKITTFIVSNTVHPGTGNPALVEVKRDLLTAPGEDAYLGDVEAVVEGLATFNITALARAISEDLSASEPEVPASEVGRHPDVEHLLSLFEYTHLPPHLRTISAQFWNVVHDMVRRLDYGTELLVGMRKLLEAKDCMVRQAVIDARTAS